MPSPTPAGGYIFPWAFQSCHTCHKRTVRRVQEAHKARPSSEGALQAPASSSSFDNWPAASLICCLILTEQELMRISCERQLRPPPCQPYTPSCWWLLHPNLQPPAEPWWKPCLSPKGLNMIQETPTEKFPHTVNTWEKSSVTTTKEHHCIVPTVTMWTHVEHHRYLLGQASLSYVLLT